MSAFRKLLTYGGTIACALGIGYVMQYGGDAPPSEPQTATVLPPVQQVALTSALPSLTDLRAPTRASNTAPRCLIAAEATPRGAALVTLSLTAPCQINQRVTIHHHGLIFTAYTDDVGTFTGDIPALHENAIFVASFSDGAGAIARTQVPDIAGFDRILVQWQGQNALELHAHEFGATYGAPGHVWSGRPDPTPHGGSVIRLGHADSALPSHMAEIYSLPRGSSRPTGAVELSLETEITEHNCNRSIPVQTIRLSGGKITKSRAFSLSIPECGRIGDFMVLNNLVDSLKIASK